MNFQPGDYIELDGMPDDPDPIPVGSRGYVVRSSTIQGMTQYTIQWDGGRSLLLCDPPDSAHVVRKVGQLTEAQESALRNLCERYCVGYDAADYTVQFDLPPGYVAGWIGGKAGHEGSHGPTIYVGCSAEGEVSS